MAYKRKTKDMWCIDTNYGYGWETESEYDDHDYKNPYESAKKDLEEYKMVAKGRGQVRLRRKRVSIK